MAFMDIGLTPVRGIVDRILQAYQPLLSLSSDDIGTIGIKKPIPVFDSSSLLELCHRARDYFQTIDALIEIPAPGYIIGDIHGNIFDLIRILILAGLPPLNRFVFLGDYVDRGEYSVEVVTLLFALCLKFPEHVFLLRGNHEFSRVNAVYGFKEEIESIFGSLDLYTEFNQAFDWIPLVAVISDTIFCVHGGISPQVTSFRQIKRIKRPLSVYDNSIACDLVWSDPSPDTKEYLRSTRGNGVAFGQTAIKDFIKVFKIKHIIRAHQCIPLGIEKFCDDTLYTVFSCSNYADSTGNRCGLLFVNGDCQIQSFSLPPIDQIPRESAAFSGAVGPGGKLLSVHTSRPSEYSYQRNPILCLMHQPPGAFVKRKLGGVAATTARLPALSQKTKSKRSQSVEPVFH